MHPLCGRETSGASRRRWAFGDLGVADWSRLRRSVPRCDPPGSVRVRRPTPPPDSSRLRAAIRTGGARTGDARRPAYRRRPPAVSAFRPSRRSTSPRSRDGGAGPAAAAIALAALIGLTRPCVSRRVLPARPQPPATCGFVPNSRSPKPSVRTKSATDPGFSCFSAFCVPAFRCAVLPDLRRPSLRCPRGSRMYTHGVRPTSRRPPPSPEPRPPPRGPTAPRETRSRTRGTP